MEKGSHWFPFPQIPYYLRAQYSLGDLSLRAFGTTEEDLGVDFNQTRPHLVTQILSGCTQDENGKTTEPLFFWNLTVGVRIECLLVLATSRGRSEILAQLRCLNDTCGQPMEMELSLEVLADLQRQTDNSDFVPVAIDDEVLQIRKPTGMDQLEWLKRSYPDENAAVVAMIQSLLVVERQITDLWIPSINEAMEEFDPLVNFSFTSYCPHCGQEGRYELDLEELSLKELHKTQLNLLETIHRLASHYHWSEGQILSIPPWRRSRYLALIEREES